jgi:two-component system sensor histidine kinase ChiS
MIISSGRRLFSLVNDILDFSKIKHKELKLKIKPVDIYALTDIVLMLSKPLVGNKPIKLLNKITPDIPFIDADENRLQQIMYNLVGNAIKFTEKGEVFIDAEIKDPLEDIIQKENQIPDKRTDYNKRLFQKSLLEISVTDTGIGIPEKKIDTVFKSFEQADSSISREYSGTGLGLAITKQLLELHGSSICVKSKLGEGSSFVFYLPISDKKSLKDNQSKQGKQDFIARTKISEKNNLEDTYFLQTESEKEGTSDYNVMIVDDDPVNIQVLLNHLSLMNYTVTTAMNGQQLLNMIQKGDKFDLILLDVMMPRLSGYEVCKKIRQQLSENELPIIMITAKNLVNDLVTGLESGANDYIVKPFEKRELIARVKTALRLKQAFIEHNELLEFEKELNIAEHVQRKVLSERQHYENIEGLEIDIQYKPMNKKVGGDYYNVSRINDHTTSVMLADATGHGIQAALTTMQIDILYKQSLIKSNPHERLEYINEFFLNELGGKNYFTAFILEISENSIRFSSAGHPNQILIRNKTNEMEYLKIRGKMIGIFNDSKYELGEKNIQSGDIIFLFSDGLYEQTNTQKEQLGEERFLEIISNETKKNKKTKKITEINQSIIGKIIQFSDGVGESDDITLIGIRIK